MLNQKLGIRPCSVRTSCCCMSLAVSRAPRKAHRVIVSSVAACTAQGIFHDHTFWFHASVAIRPCFFIFTSLVDQSNSFRGV